jgi:uncharacterized protein YbaA (DUF1428 family)
VRQKVAQIVIPLLAVAAANDWLQTGFTALCAEANVAQKRASQPAEAGADDSPDGNVTRFERPQRASRDD